MGGPTCDWCEDLSGGLQHASDFLLELLDLLLARGERPLIRLDAAELRLEHVVQRPDGALHGVELVEEALELGWNTAHRAIDPTLVVDGRGTCLDRLQSLGAAKISRLQAYGIDTVEKLAVVDVRDYPMVRLITGNKRPDRASTTIAKWRDIAQTFLARRGAGVIEPPPKKRRSKTRRKRA